MGVRNMLPLRSWARWMYLGVCSRGLGGAGAMGGGGWAKPQMGKHVLPIQLACFACGHRGAVTA